MHDDLVGFLLGALDDDEHQELANRLQSDPRLHQDLERVQVKLTPLSWDKDSPRPSVGLASQTCSFVFQSSVNTTNEMDHKYPDEMNRDPVESGSRHRAVYGGEVLAGQSSGWTFSDLFVAAGICLAAACLFFPAIVNTRYNANLAKCQNHMRQIGTALNSYSDQSGGYFPVIPAKGNMAFAGSYAAMLRDKGLIEPDNAEVLSCPSRGKTVLVHIPQVRDINSANGPKLLTIQRTIGGDFAYSLGFVKDGKLKGLKRTANRHRARFVVLADAPLGNAGREHRGVHGRGQNVLFEDGHAGFLATRIRPGSKNDDFYVNNRGLVQASHDPDDNVLGSSSTPPLIRIEDLNDFVGGAR